MKVNRCNIKICKHNNDKKCCTENVNLDYYGMDAMPTCMMFERDKIKPDVFDLDAWESDYAIDT